jgi:hypothetical protein
MHYGTRVHNFKSCIEEGDWGESSVFLGGDSNSHNGERVHMNRCLFVNSCWDRAVWMYSYSSIVSGDTEKLVIVIWISIQCLNNQSVTVHNNRSINLQSTSVHFTTGVRRSRVVRLSWLSRYFMRAEAAKMLASSSSRIFLFLFKILLYIHTHK